MSKIGIDTKTGIVNVHDLCPEPGDSIMVVNCGTHYEVRHHHWECHPFSLTDEDIFDLKTGQITWN